MLYNTILYETTQVELLRHRHHRPSFRSRILSFQQPVHHLRIC